ncbi:MAG: ABC transporter ATP-binding protein [Planctomycetota bacterium]|nr:MAG: ABC transporter ATP-binding protein [Planctomycetota bacterium]
MWQTIRQLWTILDAQERRRTVLMLVLMLGLALMEVGGVLSIAPLLAVAGNPNLVEEQPFLAWVYAAGGFTSTDNFLIACALFALTMVVATSVFRALAHYGMYRFTNMRRHTLACRLLAAYLHLPFEDFAQRNTADLAKGVLSEVDVVINKGLLQYIRLAAYTAVAMAMLVMLVIINPWLAIVLLTLLGGAYTILYLVVRGMLTHWGNVRQQANAQRYQATNETVRGHRELSILGRENAYLQAFRTPSLAYTRALTWHQTLAETPRFLLEGVAFAAMISVLLFALLVQRESLADILPMLGLYAYAGYRLLPALQQIYAALSTTRFAADSQHTLFADLDQIQNPCDTVHPRGIQQHLEIGPLRYRYPNSETGLQVPRRIDIPAGAKVQVTGPTGAGKSTLLDLILGLRQAQEGGISIDGEPLEGHRAIAWQRSLGYVPQHIFLADDTVARNIAFGIPDSRIDMAAVEQAARIASIHDEIIARPDGYDTFLGDQGARFSGGQRQRIGIARALYHQPSTLILDEATSGLDPSTRTQVFLNISQTHPELTIILVSHDSEQFCTGEKVLTVSHGEAHLVESLG